MASAVQKHFGAFYTSSPVARALVTWALRRPNENLLDPSCGEGVFLEAAAQRISKMRGNPSARIHGIEVDNSVVSKSVASRLQRVGISTKNIRVADFFDVEPSSLPKFKAVVGNPPFIRYQTFKGESREKALAIAKTLGVNLDIPQEKPRALMKMAEVAFGVPVNLQRIATEAKLSYEMVQAVMGGYETAADLHEQEPQSGKVIPLFRR